MKRTIIVLGAAAFLGISCLAQGATPAAAQPEGKDVSCAKAAAGDLTKCLQESLDALWKKVGDLETNIGKLQERAGKLETRVVKACEFFGDASGGVGNVVLLYVPESWTAKDCANYMVYPLDRWRINFACVQFGTITGPTPVEPYPNATKVAKGPVPHVRGAAGSPLPQELPQDNFCGWSTGT